MPDPVCISQPRALLGECPIWSADEGVVYWVDIRGRKIHRTDPATRDSQSWDMPQQVGMIARRQSGGLVAGLEDGIYAFNPDDGKLDRLVSLEQDRPENRPNDSKCDAAGRLWVGTMNIEDGNIASGGFYRIDADLTVTPIDRDLRIPNGLAWSPNDSRMYHTDTRAGVVHRYDYDLATGERGPAHAFLTYDRAAMGGVDGAAMDSDGGYWAALYGGAKLIRVTPAGTIDLEIPLPVSQPTMPAFGGADMKTIFVTSATQGLDDEALGAQSCAGGLLMIETAFVGCPLAPFAG